jgi:flagellar protein FliO/FliZ
MIRSITLPRAVLRAAIPAFGIAVLVSACPAQAFTPTSKAGGENTPLNISSPAAGSHSSSAGPSLVRTIVGLVIVIAVIWGLTWILRQVKSGRERGASGAGLASMATLPLGTGRALHLVRAGRDYLLMGSAEHGVVPIYRYTEQQAREAGLLDIDEQTDGTESTDPFGPGRSRTRGRGPVPGQAPAARRGAGTGTAASLVERMREWTVRR